MTKNIEVKDLKKFISNKKIKKIIIISGKKSFLQSSASKLINKKITKDVKIYNYFKKSKNPEFNELKKIVKKLKTTKPSLIIAIGGGSVMDLAKSANVLACEKTMNYKKEFIKKYCHLLCIPTTAGTGSETTPFSVLYVNKIKTSVVGPAVKADSFYFAPKLIKNCDNYTIASSGFDSLSQCIESIISKHANKKSIQLATKSIKLSLSNLLKFYKHKKEVNAKNLLHASNYSGRAITISKTGVPHALSYGFSTEFNLSHGHAISLNILNVLKLNYHNKNKSKILQKRFQILFSCFDCRNYNQFEKKMSLIIKKLNLEQNYKKLKINEQKLVKLKKFINQDRLSNNIIKLSGNDIDNILFKRL